MKNISLYLFLFISLLSLIYFLGPRPPKPLFSTSLPPVPTNLQSLDSFVAQNDKCCHVKPENNSNIYWADKSERKKTDYAIVYLHGFSASPMEGYPVDVNVAKHFGYNLYVPRLAEHGIDTSEAMQRLTADELWESAKQAYAIGRLLGNKVIIMGTSTGGSLALHLAAMFPDIAGVVVYSPNIKINNPNVWLLSKPWGLQIARVVQKGKYVNKEDSSSQIKKYWSTPYRLEAAVALQEYLDFAMTKEVFEKIHQPTLCLYYYRDKEHQDKTVRVDAIKKMFAQLATPENNKRLVAVPNAGDHVMTTPIKSLDIQTPERETIGFLSNLLGKE